MSEIKMSFWNYVPTGTIENRGAVNDWQELGMTHPMSFFYSEKRGHSKEVLLEMLDLCQEKGMKVIVDDERTDFRTLKKYGYDAYREGVKNAVNDFGKHPAVYGFHVGDEPDEASGTWDAAILAYKTCNELAPDLKHHINLLPFWGEDDESFYKSLKVHTADEYGAKVKDFILQCGAKIISYDYYGQCCYFDAEKYKDICFTNLRIFEKAVRGTGAELFNCPLCVGHWSLRVPNEDDIRWQIYTSIASGVVGLSWFFVYERFLDGSFRNSPIDLFWHKTETYGRLARQCNIIKKYYSFLKDYEFMWAKHANKAYGGYELFTEDEDLAAIETCVNECPLIVSKFKGNDGSILIAVTNNSQTLPTSIKLHFRNRLGMYKDAPRIWIEPGRMRVFAEQFRI